MSCKLIVRKMPKECEEWNFKMKIRDALYSKFGNYISGNEAISYLEGLRDSADEDDSLALQGMINALYEDCDLTLNMEC